MTLEQPRTEAGPRLIGRLHQCPGCWSYGMYTIDRDWECDCGEALTPIDLRPASPSVALDFDSAGDLLSAYNYWVNDHPDATVGDRYDWTKRYLAHLTERTDQ